MPPTLGGRFTDDGPRTTGAAEINTWTFSNKIEKVHDGFRRFGGSSSVVGGPLDNSCAIPYAAFAMYVRGIADAAE